MPIKQSHLHFLMKIPRNKLNESKDTSTTKLESIHEISWGMYQIKDIYHKFIDLLRGPCSWKLSIDLIKSSSKCRGDFPQY